jgi:UDP-N-acetyl-D-galactosamine dehydrogenase
MAMNTFDFPVKPIAETEYPAQDSLSNKKKPSIYQLLCDKEASVAVIGLGQVGLATAIEFARDFNVIGFDTNEELLESLKESKIHSNHSIPAETNVGDIHFTSAVGTLMDADVYIIAVPTTVTQNKQPDLNRLLEACRIVGNTLGRGDIVVLESTVYPGCIEEECIPVIERESGLKMNADFKIGYSPERSFPGNKKDTLANTTRIVSGSDSEAEMEI